MTLPLRIGIWALVHGNRAALHDPEEPYDASWARNRRLVLEAEALGYDCVLIAQHTMNPHKPELGQLEAWTSAAALAAETRRIELIAAIKPMLYHPVVLAKMALQIEEISGGRFAINLVNAWNRKEIEDAGMVFREHDERYAYGAEWLSVVERLMRGEAVQHDGRYFQVRDYMLRPTAATRARPRIYVGGESDPARDLVAALADVWFINGQPLENVQALIADVRRRPRAGAPVRFGLSTFVIARETEEEAQAEYRRLLDLAQQDGEIKAYVRANTDPAVVMRKTQAKFESVGTNGGTAAGTVGSYDQVAARLAAFHEAGIDTLLTQFQPFEREMRRFAEHVRPRLRAMGATAG
ncbi:LLM class flavin-dependent oxidoreductase [Siccirubricoccus sp. KC 17139]|uniref:LLM class flavin-dependent oxidoreductase n=1 Tax=Siccirubricoccus soli TaxID=2899147 RepID=A0ABT1DDH9_9PROT|nr:LLM class flavin-dependent oxidoreductase [Siccirubricoccus soli]MCO6419997.1 LLM class flavin-dependent oxidoreductase [Siccirubricoccus soli]MCP2686132.1 LLM class flavin-dependent oxidoreductase [Siccirubricoccus soli]